MKKNIKVVTLIFLSLITTGCWDYTPPSDPVNMDNIVGAYTPNHNGDETLQLLSNHVWVRTYRYSVDSLAVDSGSWKLDSLGWGSYDIQLDSMFHRHKYWANHPYRPKSVRRGDGLPTTPGWFIKPIRNDDGRLRIEFSDEYDLYYEKDSED